MDEFDQFAEGGDPQPGRRDQRIYMGDGENRAPGWLPKSPPERIASWIATLEQVIKVEVLPRLIAAHPKPPSGQTPGAPAHGPALADHLDDFIRLLLKPDGDAALARVAALQADGALSQSICLDLLTPAARRLGLLWIEDDCDFLEVTVGVQILHRILRTLRSDRLANAEGDSLHNRFLLTAAPGETHVFGVAIVEKFFHDAGWDVVRSNETAFMDELKTRWFHLAGFSLSENRNLGRLETAITKARRCSVNPDLRILVGGPVFLDNPELAKRAGADAMAHDAASAVIWAGNLRYQNVVV